MSAPIDTVTCLPQRGLTLLELLVVLAIAGSLLSLAMPAYQRLILGAQRSEARAQLLQVASLQVQYRLREGRYADSLQALGMSEATNGRYRVMHSDAQGLHWQARAEAVGQQARDRDCLHWYVDDLGQRQAWDAQGVLQSRCW